MSDNLHQKAIDAFQDVYNDEISRLEDLIAEGHNETSTLSEAYKSLEREHEEVVEQLHKLIKTGVKEDPWEVLYTTDFATNDGWSARTETQSNDNSYNTPANVTYTDEEGLLIYGRRQRMGNRPFTTGDVTGQHIRVPNYFRAEVTATIPTDYGMWPCPLWLRPLTHGDSGEIDCGEMWTYDWNRTEPMVWFTIWENYTSKRKENVGFKYSTLPEPDPSLPHTYSVEKTRGRIAFYVDSILAYEWTIDGMNDTIKNWYNSVYEIRNREWYPRITLQIGGPNSKDPKPEWNESALKIHHLAIYKLKD